MREVNKLSHSKIQKYTLIRLYKVVFWIIFLENPGEIGGNPKSVRDSWKKTKIREPPSESGRVGKYLKWIFVAIN